jgi:glycosyltransferase involved in cell wall biosynthesis
MISVTIATLDRPRYLEKALETLLAGTSLPEEIVVVDQSEGDETRRIVEAAGSSLIRYHHHSPPQLSASRNRSVELANGEYVAIVDDDDEFAPDWLASVESELRRFSYPDALFGDIRNPRPDEDGDAVGVSIMRHERDHVWSYPAHPGLMGYGAHMIVRRETFLRLRGFDSRLGPGTALLGAEDIDFNYRLLREGCAAVSTPAIHVVHNQPRQQEDLPRYYFGKNKGQAAFVVKHLCDGDRYAWRVLLQQCGADLRVLASAVKRRSGLRARIAARRAAGTLSGLWHGARTFRR